jgi:hypothetical protein
MQAGDSIGTAAGGKDMWGGTDEVAPSASTRRKVGGHVSSSAFSFSSCVS